MHTDERRGSASSVDYETENRRAIRRLQEEKRQQRAEEQAAADHKELFKLQQFKDVPSRSAKSTAMPLSS
jgi:hypothetical protein